MATFSYDNAARLSGQAFAGASTGYGYDGISRLWTLGHDLVGVAADQSLTFGYNPASQVKTRTSANDAYVSNTAYAVNRSYSVNGLNQYTAAGPAAFTYDANGNLTSDGSTTYVYDAENRLVSASGATNATLSYDPLGRLFQVAGTAGTTQFLYDGDELVAEYDTAGTMLRRYAHGTGTDDPVLWYEGATFTQRRGLLRDHQGSIVAVADSTGNALAINAYDSWGIPNAGNLGRFQYTGQAWLPELGMYHYKARIYSPTLGRFLQTDPVGYDDQVNLYAYVGNDPVNKTDSTGEAIDIILDIAFIANDIADIASNGLNATNGVSLGANLVGAAIPGVTGLGAGTRAISQGANAARAAQVADRAVSRIGARSNVLNRRHYSAAIREARGEVVARRPDGKPFDHINELRESVSGLRNDLRQAEASLRSGNLSPGDTDRVRESIRSGQRLLNEARSVLRRVDSCTGTLICR